MLGIGGLIGQLWEDGLALAHAEIALVKSKIFATLRRSRNAIILLLVAATIAFASVIALMLGFVLALLPIVGGALAGLIVMVGGLLLAGLLIWIAIKLFAAPSADPGPEETA